MLFPRARQGIVAASLVLFACACGGGGDDSDDAGPPDAASSDAGTDAGNMGSADGGVAGDTCTASSDCRSGVCIAVSPDRMVCADRCVGDTDCVAGWACAVVGDEFMVRACVCDAAAELCNEMDDDCDLLIDEELGECCEPGTTRPCGSTVGSCTAGTETCLAAGSFGACEGMVGPSAELCDGDDNDCDPMTADGAEEPTLGAACDGLDTDLCEEGVVSCTVGALSCSDMTMDDVETCDGRDEDCDGMVDEDVTGCCSYPEMVGRCSTVTITPPRSCVAADLVPPALGARVMLGFMGADQTFVVPTGVTSLNVELWGAGGSDSTTGGPGSAGGGGAFATATLPVTPGESLTVVVGEGGGSGFTRTPIYGGGGHGGFFGANGGGRSAMRRGATELITAAGGGGGGNCNSAGPCGPGGAGGAAMGEDGMDSPTVDSTYGLHGTGATHMCGGSGGITTCGCGLASGAGEGGSQLQGGSTIGSAPGQGAGGGGGGFFGGGSGGGDCGGNTGGGGGGGSSFVDPAIGCALGGSGSTPGNDTDPDRTGTLGVGGTAMAVGGNGLVVIRY